MTPADLEGAVFGPTVVPVSAEHVADFVAATGDDAGRWVGCAPPGFASVLLFAVAGDFLWDDRISAHTRTLLHLDQAFTYEGPMFVGNAVEVVGRVTRARERSGSHFVTFEAEAARAGRALVRSTSTFVMSAQATGDPGDDHGEPRATVRATNDVPRRLPPVVGVLPPLHKSASRADLVRYAAVTKDFNPIHWDHDAARAGGAPGVIVHGLLILTWALQAASAIGSDADPIAHAKVRFRNALRPGEQAVIASNVGDLAPDGRKAQVALAVLRGADELATGGATVRTNQG
jgi:acyl dehydratase/acyl-CoA thioesterase FadM